MLLKYWSLSNYIHGTVRLDDEQVRNKSSIFALTQSVDLKYNSSRETNWYLHKDALCKDALLISLYISFLRCCDSWIGIYF